MIKGISVGVCAVALSTALATGAISQTLVFSNNPVIQKGIKDQGTYSATTAYTANDLVLYNDGVYLAMQPSTGQRPDAATSIWKALTGSASSMSAYQQAQVNGFSGTQAEWLASLVGPAGAPGANGAAGAPGPVGPQGPAGAPATGSLSDAYSKVLPTGERDAWFMNGVAQGVRAYNGGTTDTHGLQVFLDGYGASWNNGSYTRPDGSSGFSTRDSTALNMQVGSSASEITGGINMTFQHYGYNGDSHPFYVYDNFMPGTVTAGSDEGHAAIRIASLPSATFKATVSADAGNTTGASQVRFTNPAYCGGAGSSFGIKTCLGAGGWMLDKSDPIYTNLHMTAYKGTTPQSPMLVTVAETLTPDSFVTTTTSLDAANMATGDTQSFPVTLPAGFVAPKTSTACLSAYGENAAEEVGYTLKGSMLTITGHRLPHYVPSGGVMHIALRSCASAVWRQDAADNGTGSTGYVVMGALDAHTLVVTTSGGGSRANGTVQYGKSIRPDGATLGAFDVFPAALVLDVVDPTYAPVADVAPMGIYSYGPLFAHLGTNTVPWATGKAVEEAYNFPDTYYQQRYQCDTPLADTTVGSACRYTELRGSVQRLDEVVLTNPVGAAARRGRPDILTVRPYNFSGGLGTYSHLAGTSIAPTDGWLVSTAFCGESLMDPTGCPDHSLWEEGGLGKIVISGKNKALTFNMGAYDPAVHFTFQQGVSAYTLHANNGFSGTCATGKMTVVDGIVTGCAP